MGRKWLTIAELSKLCDIPNSSTRRYLDRFSEFFRVDDRGRAKKYHPDAVAVLTRIKALYAAGSQAEEVDAVLSEEFPVVITMGEEVDKSSPPPPVPLYATKEDVQALYDKLDELADTNEKLLRLVESQDELQRKVSELEVQLEEKDQELVELKSNKSRSRLWRFLGK